jgi:hypothetical protein
MTMQLEQFMIDTALTAAAHSPCRSKRGVVLYDPCTGAFRGSGFNSPPNGCPGRAICAGMCGRRAVHAEVRALREAEIYRRNGHPPGPYDLIHVELAADGGVVACDGPSCPGCAAQILDVGFVGGVWLYERDRCPHCVAGDIPPHLECPRGAGGWRRYTAADFYDVTMSRVRK